MTETELHAWCEKIFYPQISINKERMIRSGLKLAHYTSAESCLKIIRSKSIWMRSVGVMNDVSEFRHGTNRVLKFLSGETEAKKKIFHIAKLVQGVGEEQVKETVKCWLDGISQVNVYTASFTEHCDVNEQHGRLSMWRGYGEDQSKAAIIFDKVTSTRIQNVDYLLAPVCYYSEEEFENCMLQVAFAIERNVDTFKQWNNEFFIQYLCSTFYVASVTLKEKSFREEQEWRAVYIHRPNSHGRGLKSSIQVVAGIPQIINAIDFSQDQMTNHPVYDFNYFFDKVIIGPTNFAGVIVVVAH